MKRSVWGGRREYFYTICLRLMRCRVACRRETWWCASGTRRSCAKRGNANLPEHNVCTQYVYLSQLSGFAGRFVCEQCCGLAPYYSRVVKPSTRKFNRWNYYHQFAASTHVSARVSLSELIIMALAPAGVGWYGLSGCGWAENIPHRIVYTKFTIPFKICDSVCKCVSL